MNTTANRSYPTVLILSVILSLLSTITNRAQELSRVRIQVNVRIQCKGSKPTDTEMADAMLAGKRDMVSKYIIQATPARRQLLSDIREKLENNPNLVVGDAQIVAQDYDKKSKTLDLSVVGYVSENIIDAMVPRPAGTKNYMSLIFVARRQTSVKSSGPEVITGTSQVDATTKLAKEESSGSEAIVSVTTKNDSAVISRSAVSRVGDRIGYDVSASDSLDTAMEGVFAEHNFKVVPAATVRKKSNGAFAVEKFLESFKTGNDIDPELLQNAAEACTNMKPKLPFYGFGTLTLEPPQRDEVSGRTRVNVQVYAKVIDCREDFATTAASIEAIQYTGLGESATEAETVALTGAAKTAAKMIADKLNAKGIY